MVVSSVTFFFACDNEYEEVGAEKIESQLKGTDNALDDEVRLILLLKKCQSFLEDLKN